MRRSKSQSPGEKYLFSLNPSKKARFRLFASFSTVLSGKSMGVFLKARVTSSPHEVRASHRETAGSEAPVHFQSLRR